MSAQLFEAIEAAFRAIATHSYRGQWLTNYAAHYYTEKTRHEGQTIEECVCIEMLRLLGAQVLQCDECGGLLDERIHICKAKLKREPGDELALERLDSQLSSLNVWSRLRALEERSNNG